MPEWLSPQVIALLVAIFGGGAGLKGGELYYHHRREKKRNGNGTLTVNLSDHDREKLDKIATLLREMRWTPEQRVKFEMATAKVLRELRD